MRRIGFTLAFLAIFTAGMLAGSLLTPGAIADTKTAVVEINPPGNVVTPLPGYNVPTGSYILQPRLQVVSVVDPASRQTLIILLDNMTGESYLLRNNGTFFWSRIGR